MFKVLPVLQNIVVVTTNVFKLFTTVWCRRVKEKALFKKREVRTISLSFKGNIPLFLRV